ncbi:uncharacterized protein PHALS_01676 [Plasmopara halstedii]|uniref:Uncharacterized protein n=1 Tax=Plasmopara halstedii TaxID=4781 RepID=A0A0P1AU02_PLAHL|nr:uncharacterized protein PHALS_01676 [Plasmopara halstedii]CEG45374.1 hypothetical protein PHALS_01676 [Plasmopara halstedii]|eukprot:XP_024581743.1 hypothetical protein PHALS_01676 [Plasmopara halstedii]
MWQLLIEQNYFSSALCLTIEKAFQNLDLAEIPPSASKQNTPIVERELGLKIFASTKLNLQQLS